MRLCVTLGRGNLSWRGRSHRIGAALARVGAVLLHRPQDPVRQVPPEPLAPLAGPVVDVDVLHQPRPRGADLHDPRGPSEVQVPGPPPLGWRIQVVEHPHPAARAAVLDEPQYPLPGIRAAYPRRVCGAKAKGPAPIILRAGPSALAPPVASGEVWIGSDGFAYDGERLFDYSRGGRGIPNG